MKLNSRLFLSPFDYSTTANDPCTSAIAEWKDLIRGQRGKKHMELVTWLKQEHGMGHSHANALVADTLRD